MHRQAGMCVLSRLCMAVAGPNRVEQGMIFFSRAENCLFFRKSSNSTWLAHEILLPSTVSVLPLERFLFVKPL